METTTFDQVVSTTVEMCYLEQGRGNSGNREFRVPCSLFPVPKVQFRHTLMPACPQRFIPPLQPRVSHLNLPRARGRERKREAQRERKAANCIGRNEPADRFRARTPASSAETPSAPGPRRRSTSHLHEFHSGFLLVRRSSTNNMGQARSSPAERFEELRQRIASRRLRHTYSRVEVSSHEYETSDCLSRGDEIRRRLTGSTVGWHHGIYVGDGQVCDLMRGCSPAEIPMEEFLDGLSSFEVVAYNNDSPEARADTADIAIMVISEPCWKDAQYDLLSHNCEHLAKFCRTGSKRSTQVQQGGVGVSGIGALLLLGSVGSVQVLSMAGENDDSD